MFAKKTYENHRNWSPPPDPFPAERQVAMALSLLELYGASPDKNLWRAIDEVVMKRNRKIDRLELELKIIKNGGNV